MNEAWRIAVIADDLTGACDTGVQFAAPGSPSAVFVADGRAVSVKEHADDEHADDELHSVLESSRHVIVDTESRHETAEKAYDRVRATAEHLGDPSVELAYKKIDSTLRGNVRSELGAVQDAFPDRVAVIAPAYPAAGRTVVDGRCLVDGRPVDETEFGRDRRSPVTSARLADYVRAGARVFETRAGTLAGVLRETRRGDVVIVDASTDGELDAIAALVAADPRRYIPVGSAGLAGALRRARADDGVGSSVGAQPSPVARPGAEPGVERAAVFGLVGSVSERSRIQAAHLRATADVLPVILDPRQIAGQVEQISAALSGGQDVVLATPLPSDAEAPDAEAQAMAGALGQIARAVVDRVPRIGLFMTGGDTALSVMHALDARMLLVYRELAAGIPVVAIEYWSGDRRRRIPAITKAGGFGSDTVMIEAFDCLRGETCLQ